MTVYRISKREYAHDMSGYGAKLFGGRWNLKDTACVYTSSSISLAILEYYANVNKVFVHYDLSLVEIELSDEVVVDFDNEELPKDWNSIPFGKGSQEFGSNFFRKNDKAMRVPSAVIIQESNIVLSPILFLEKKAKVIYVTPLKLDNRINSKFAR